MNIIAFGGSCSSSSINKAFATYALAQFPEGSKEVLDLRDYSLPLFTTDLEEELGHPSQISDFLSKIESADLLIISMAEHNGSYTAAFKSLFDWTSRVKLNMFEGKKIWLLSTSPGGRGGASSLETAKQRFPRHGAQIVGTFSLPNFYDNFSKDTGITKVELNEQFQAVLDAVVLEMRS